MPKEVRQYKIVLQEMAMFVKAEVITLEAIVHIYLAGPQGFFVDSFAASTDWYHRLCIGRLEELGMVFTPSTKEDQGNHDQNVSCEEGAFFSLIVIQCTSNHNRHCCSFKLIGSALCFPVSTVTLSLSTKFEFGLLPATLT